MSEYAEYAELWRSAELGVPEEELTPTADESVYSPEEALERLRELALSPPEAVYADTSDVGLRRFLHARKNMVAAALTLLVNNGSYRRKHQGTLFASFHAHAQDVRGALRDGVVGVLPERDAHGRPVIVLTASHWDPARWPITSVFRTVLLSLDRLSEDEATQRAGIEVILDLSGASVRQSSSLTPWALHMIVSGLQDCYPARLGGVHLVNQPWHVEALLSLVKPFLKDKTADKVHVHGNNLSSLHAHLSRRILPAELGGDGPALDTRRWAALVIDAPADSDVGQRAAAAHSPADNDVGQRSADGDVGQRSAAHSPADSDVGQRSSTRIPADMDVGQRAAAHSPADSDAGQLLSATHNPAGAGAEKTQPEDGGEGDVDTRARAGASTTDRCPEAGEMEEPANCEEAD